jgi:hypothetical protein
MNEQLQSNRNLGREHFDTSSNDLSGQLVPPNILPDLKSLYQNPDLIRVTLTIAELAVGKNFLEIDHFYPQSDRDKPYFSTSLTNRSAEKIRIDRFGSYTQQGDNLVLYTMTGGLFSAQQFREWYSNEARQPQISANITANEEPEQFPEWLHLTPQPPTLSTPVNPLLGDEWIAPGEVITDPNNHSNLGVYWVYFGTTFSGESFVAGAPWLGVKPWWQLW